MQNELISIVVPIYNVEEFLPNCINSLLNQTYQSTEILLIDDGSTDRCKDICDNYATKYENVYAFHKENGGLSDARNYGIDKARGKYICFVDSDDYVDRKFCEILYKNLIESQADISVCDFIRTQNMNDNKTINYQNETITIYSKKIDKQKNILNELNEITTVAWNKLYKIELWSEIKYPKGRINEDEFVIHYLLDECKKVVYTNLKLYYYYQRNNSIMKSKYNEKRLDVVEAFKERLDFYKDRENYNLLVPRAYVLFMKMIITNYSLAKEYKDSNISKKMIKRYKKEYNKKIKEIGRKDKIQLMLFYYFPNMYYLIKKGVSYARKRFKYNISEK